MKKPNERKNVMKKRPLLTNEDGSVMIVALALLMLLTLIGISATTTSMIEIQISGAKKTYTDHLFQAEGAAMQCAQDMQNDPTNTTYINDKELDDVDDDDIRDLFKSPLKSVTTPSIGTGYAAVHQGVVGSMKLGQPTLHAYTVYGWHDTPQQGRVIVELGYRRAFE